MTHLIVVSFDAVVTYKYPPFLLVIFIQPHKKGSGKTKLASVRAVFLD